MSTVQRYISAFKGDQYVAMQQVNTELDQIRAVIGRPKSGFVDAPNGVTQSNPLTTNGPPQAQFAVVGIDGKFVIQIQDPQLGLPESANLASTYATAGLNPQFAPILHNLQSSATVNFDNSSSLADYGISAQVGYTFQNPNATLFWRLRSSYDGKTWNKWQIYSSALTCGPVGVYSGLLRTSALTNVNSANTPNVQPLTQSGTSTKILVAQSTVTFGSGPPVTYNAGSVDPGAYGVSFVYCLDPQRLGGNVTYVASFNNPDVTNNDALVYFGVITTSGGGGGTGDGGGGGPCCVAEVESTMFGGAVLPQSALRKGMILEGVDAGPEPIERIELVPNVPCFRYTGENGLVLRGCSSQHSLQYDGGGFDHSFVIVSGHRVATKAGATRILREFIGHRTVYRLHLGGKTKTYWADGFASHNVRKV